MTYSIHYGAIASGKTTKAIQWLDEQGGGTFITRNPAEVRHVLNNIASSLKHPEKIYILDPGKAIAVDDVDSPQIDVRIVASQRKRND